jgi:hypothetical protein
VVAPAYVVDAVQLASAAVVIRGKRIISGIYPHPIDEPQVIFMFLDVYAVVRRHWLMRFYFNYLYVAFFVLLFRIRAQIKRRW